MDLVLYHLCGQQHHVPFRYGSEGLESNIAHFRIVCCTSLDLWRGTLVVDKLGRCVAEYPPYLGVDLHSQRFRTFINIATLVAAACFIGENIPFEGCIVGTF